MTVSKVVILKYIFIDFKSTAKNLSDNFLLKLSSFWINTNLKSAEEILDLIFNIIKLNFRRVWRNLYLNLIIFPFLTPEKLSLYFI